VFNSLSDCPVHFFEKDCNASLLPARLAEIAGVPLMAVAPELVNRTIHINKGPQSDVKKFNFDPCKATKNFLAFFEMEIRRNPSIWSVFVCESLSKYQSSITTATILNRAVDNKQVPEF
jgi:lauroyl/myristoyl acyltransferase